MRIAMIGPFGLHPKQTMRSRALGLARPLVQRGHQVRLFMPPWDTPDEADRAWEENGVELRYVPLRGGVIGITRSLVSETLAWRPDVAHCFKPKAYSGLVAEWLWRFHRRRVRVIMDADDWEGPGGWNDVAPYSTLQKRFFARQERWGLTHNHAVTVASRTLEGLAGSLGVPPERVVYVPNGPGIPLRDISSVERATVRERLGLGERPTVLVYSRLFEFETARLAAVLAGVKEQLPDMVVLLVGAGLYKADADRFLTQLADAALLGSVLDVGWTPLEDLPATLAAADLGLYMMDDTLLNRAKCPVKLADILATGVPVVGEAVGQVSEYIQDGRTGALVASGDVTGLVMATVELLEDAEERKHRGKAARADVRDRFDWDSLIERVFKTYAE
ncbi:MAG: glycosyltransferase family 4 protein [Chloroflexota bacterium]|jgi:glycosyltransferase involved in cell wall biosynthesis